MVENGASPDFLRWSLRFAWATANVWLKSENTRLITVHAHSFRFLRHNSEGAKWLTVIHKDQRELIFGPTILKLHRVRTLILWRQLIEQNLHQTFRLVKFDLAVLPKREEKRQPAHTHMIPNSQQVMNYKEAGVINDYEKN